MSFVFSSLRSALESVAVRVLDVAPGITKLLPKLSGRIDTHIHMIPPSYRDALERNGGDPSGWETPSWTPEECLAFIDSISVEFAVLSITSPGPMIAGAGQEGREVTRKCNEETADIVLRSKGRFGFFASLPLVPLWHTVELPAIEEDKKPAQMGDSERTKRTAALLAKAKKLWDEDAQKHASRSRMSASDRDFITHVLRSGTANDRVSALQLLVQESPVHNFARLDTDLTNMCSKKARREAVQAMEAVAELCAQGLLPERKLRYFADRPLFVKGVTDAHLVMWAFEDALKNWYFRFLRILETMTHDPLAHPKRRAMHRIVELLAAKPEQEQNLLLLLVNKFGDAEKQIPSLVSHLLLNLLKQHPAMKLVVISEIERFLARPQSSARARYHAITFLDQIVLSHKEADVKAANKLVEIYFGIFEQVLKKPETEKEEGANAPAQPAKRDKKRHRDRGKPKKNLAPLPGQSLQEFEAKMVAAVLTGINRAWPYSKLDDAVFDKHVDTLFTVSHSAAFNTAVQALNFVCQVSSSRQATSDRLCRAVYEVMLHPALFGTTHQAPFFNLVYKVIKTDQSQARAQAMLKRLLQVAGGQQAPFAVASLFLAGEAIKERPGLMGAVRMPEPKEDDDEEKFVDVKLDDEEEGKGEYESDSEEKSSSNKPAVNKHLSTKYDPFKREPLHCHADQSCFWELNELAQHFHPTVRLYARRLLDLEPLPIPQDTAGYDPLRNHGLMPFLDRFVFKNPRKADKEDASSTVSAMKPKDEAAATDRDKGVLFHGGKKRMVVKDGRVAMGDLPVNDDAWLRKAEKEGAPEDEKFFFTFFQNKSKLEPKRSFSSKKAESDDGEAEEAGSVASDEVDSDQEFDEDEVWDAMVKSSGFPKPDAGEEDDDDEFDLGDDDSDEESEEGNSDLESGGSGEEGSDEELDVEGLESALQEDEEGDEDLEHEASESDDGARALPGQQDSDDDMPDFDGSASDEEDEQEASKPTFLARKAQSLGYRGDYFAKKRGTVLDSTLRGFASAEDFDALLNNNEGEDFGFADGNVDEQGSEDDGEEELQRPAKKKQRRNTKGDKQK